MSTNLAPFAAVEAMVNQGVEQHLATATATFNGGEPFGVLFDREPVDSLGAVATYAATAEFALAHAPGIAQGGVLLVDGRPYAVAGGVEPDASGWVRIQLREGGV